MPKGAINVTWYPHGDVVIEIAEKNTITT